MAVIPQTAEQISSDILVDILSSSPQTVTDANPGSVLSTIVEAPAVEMEKIYSDLITETDQGIQSSIYSNLQMTNLPAQAAYGPVTFSVPTAPSAATDIPQGTTVAVTNLGLTYTTNTDVQIAANTTSVPATVTCTQAGSVGNVVAGAISVIVSPSSVVAAGVTVTNAYAFTTGYDAETNAEKAARAQQVMAGLHRGDQYALSYGALQAVVTDSSGLVTEQVVKSQAVASGAVGTADVYIYNGTVYGASIGSASSALISACQNEIDGYVDSSGITHYGWIIIGQVATVIAATETLVPVSITLTLAPGYTLGAITNTVQNAIMNYFGSLEIGAAVSLSAIAEAARQVVGVYDAIVTAPVSAPAATNGVLYMTQPSSIVLST